MFDGHYLEWNNRRIKLIIDQYKHDFFARKKILDLGCGHADISGVLYRLGGDVTAVDARQEHLKIVEKKYAGIKIVKADLDRGWPFIGRSFDITLHLGLLSYLNSFEDHLKSVISSTEYLVLETAVANSSSPTWCVVKSSSKSNYDESANGVQTEVSAAAIERVLSENGMTFERMNKSKLNSGSYRYDWLCTNDGTFDSNLRRLWFCQKNTKGPITFSFHNTPPSLNLQNSNIPVVAAAPPLPPAPVINQPTPLVKTASAPPSPPHDGTTLLYLSFGNQTDISNAFRKMGVKLMVFNYWNMWQQNKNEHKVKEEFLYLINQFKPQFVHVDLQSSNIINDNMLSEAQRNIPQAIFTKCSGKVKDKIFSMSNITTHISYEQLKGLLSSNE